VGATANGPPTEQSVVSRRTFLKLGCGTLLSGAAASVLAPVMPSCFGQKYASGLVRGSRTLVYVNRGVGLISQPVRLKCRSESTILRLWRSPSHPSWVAGQSYWPS